MSVFTPATRYLAIPFASPSLRHHTYRKLCTPVHCGAWLVRRNAVSSLESEGLQDLPDGYDALFEQTLGVGYTMNGAQPHLIYIYF